MSTSDTGTAAVVIVDSPSFIAVNRIRSGVKLGPGRPPAGMTRWAPRRLRCRGGRRAMPYEGEAGGDAVGGSRPGPVAKRRVRRVPAGGRSRTQCLDLARLRGDALGDREFDAAVSGTDHVEAAVGVEV